MATLQKKVRQQEERHSAYHRCFLVQMQTLKNEIEQLKFSKDDREMTHKERMRQMELNAEVAMAAAEVQAYKEGILLLDKLNCSSESVHGAFTAHMHGLRNLSLHMRANSPAEENNSIRNAGSNSDDDFLVNTYATENTPDAPSHNGHQRTRRVRT